MNEIILIGGMALVTFLIRYPILALVSRIKLPDRLFKALRFVAPSVLSAIILPGLLMPGGSLFLSIQNTHLVAGVVTAGVMVWSKNLLVTIVVGMVVFLLLNLIAAV
jgi:branched-subunit amino acid transport protein